MDVTNLVAKYYDEDPHSEWDRLDRHPFEFEITKRHIAPLLKPKSRIADIGGGPGKYSLHFANLGHLVTLFDLSAGNIELAKAKAAENDIPIHQFYTGSATDLSDLPSDHFDLTLCMGPLYHLQTAIERDKVIRECIRITRHDGIMVFAYVSMFAHVIPLAIRSPEKLPDVQHEMRKAVSGHGQPNGHVFGFTAAHYSRTTDIENEIARHDLKLEVLAGVETIGWMVEQKWDHLSNDAREAWFDLCFSLSTEPSARGLSQHFVAICRKPSTDGNDGV